MERAVLATARSSASTKASSVMNAAKSRAPSAAVAGGIATVAAVPGASDGFHFEKLTKEDKQWFKADFTDDGGTVTLYVGSGDCGPGDEYYSIQRRPFG